MTKGYPNLKYNPSDSDFVNSNGIKWWYLYNDGVTEGMLSYVPGAQKTKALMERKAFMIYKPELGLIQTAAGFGRKDDQDEDRRDDQKREGQNLLGENRSGSRRKLREHGEECREDRLAEAGRLGEQNVPKKKDLFKTRRMTYARPAALFHAVSQAKAIGERRGGIAMKLGTIPLQRHGKRRFRSGTGGLEPWCSDHRKGKNPDQ